MCLYGNYSRDCWKERDLRQYHQPQPPLPVPGAGLVDKVLPTRLVGHLDELVLVALGQHLLHGSWGTERLSVCIEESV